MIDKKKKTRNTVQKKIILDTLKKLNNHPTVEDVHAEVKETYSTISKNTVYRNLRQLADDGEIRKVSFPGEPERYDSTNVRHYHFQCKICSSMSDIEIEYLDDINKAVKKKQGLHIDEHEIVFRGICLQCENV